MQSEDGGYSDYVGTPEFDEFEALIIELFRKDMKATRMLFSSRLLEIEDYNVRITKAYANMVVGHMDLASAYRHPVGHDFSAHDTEFFRIRMKKGGCGMLPDGWVSSMVGEAPRIRTWSMKFCYDTKSCDLHQTLYHLPKGYYRVVYNGLYRAGELISAALARRDSADSWHAEAYVEVGQRQVGEDSIHFRRVSDI